MTRYISLLFVIALTLSTLPSVGYGLEGSCRAARQAVRRAEADLRKTERRAAALGRMLENFIHRRDKKAGHLDRKMERIMAQIDRFNRDAEIWADRCDLFGGKACRIVNRVIRRIARKEELLAIIEQIFNERIAGDNDDIEEIEAEQIETEDKVLILTDIVDELDEEFQDCITGGDGDDNGDDPIVGE